LSRSERASLKYELRVKRRIEKLKSKALKEAAKVVVDYRPVMSTIIDDYLFRCPTWQLAQLLSDGRERRGNHHRDNIFMYRFSQPTHIPGYKECWGKACHTSELPYVFQSMDVIRSNYSTLGPLAEREAPKPREFPYTEIMNAYRGAFEANTDDVLLESNYSTGWKRGEDFGATDQNHTQTKAFQRIIDHFFGDYFTVDVDEELASDMAERWSSFAREGSPNYDASMTEWLPWRYRPPVDTDETANEVDNANMETNMWEYDDEDDAVWDILDELDNTDTDEFNNFLSDEGDQNDIDFTQADIDMEYRRRALKALQLEVADEGDVFRTELRYVQNREGDNLAGRHFFLKTLYWGKELKSKTLGGRRSMQEILQLARSMGVIGIGLTHDDSNRGLNNDFMDEEFFPQLLDLSWPPELRLIEKDCTCDLWDRIRYRY